MASSRILQIFLRVTVQNQVRITQRVVVNKVVQFRLLRPRQAGGLSHRKRAVKPLIARRAFFLPPLVRLHCTARIPACDSAYLEFYRITVRFFTDIAFVSHFSTYTECTPVRFLFAVYSRSAGFIRALFARLRVFSVNSA